MAQSQCPYRLKDLNAHSCQVFDTPTVGPDVVYGMYAMHYSKKSKAFSKFQKDLNSAPL